jgi:hypothetical protein
LKTQQLSSQTSVGQNPHGTWPHLGPHRLRIASDFVPLIGTAETSVNLDLFDPAANPFSQGLSANGLTSGKRLHWDLMGFYDGLMGFYGT